jgi:hypothetical protein
MGGADRRARIGDRDQARIGEGVARPEQRDGAVERPIVDDVLLSDAKQPQVPMLTPLGPTITVPLLVTMLLSPAAMPRPPAPS